MIDAASLAYIRDEKHAQHWIDYQNTLNCCGYRNEGKTGAMCNQPSIRDCRNDVISVFGDHLIISCIILSVLTICIWILSLSTKCFLKDGVCNQ